MKGNTSDPRYDGFRTPTEGEYRLRITDVSSETAQSSGNQYFNWEYEVVGGDFDGCKVWDITTITEKALWRLVVLLKAAGFDGDFDTDDLDAIWKAVEGKTLRAKLFVETYEGKGRAKVGEYIAPDSSAPAADDSNDESDVPY